MKEFTCGFCGAFMDANDKECPNCGAPNQNYNRTANEAPKTINELQQWCDDNKIDLSNMHIYIGEDFKGAKAFGIFKDGSGKVTVYKNKDTGERTIRYEGYDEEYGVNELFQKIKNMYLTAKEATLTENSNSKFVKKFNLPKIEHNKVNTTSITKKKKPSIFNDINIEDVLQFIMMSVVVLLIAGTLGFGMYALFNTLDKKAEENGGYLFYLDLETPQVIILDNGYYNYEEVNYYHHSPFWYYYNSNVGMWDYTDRPDGITADNYVGVDGMEEPFPTEDFSSEWGNSRSSHSNSYFVYNGSNGSNDYYNIYVGGSGSSYDGDSSYDGGSSYDYDWGGGWDSGDYGGGYDGGYDYGGGYDWGSDW